MQHVICITRRNVTITKIKFAKNVYWSNIITSIIILSFEKVGSDYGKV